MSGSTDRYGGEAGSPERLTLLFRDVVLKSKAIARRRMGTFGLTYTEMLLLTTLMQRRTLTVGELATDLGIALATVSRLLGKLEDKGYVGRRVHSGDRRCVQVRLGPRGRGLHRKISSFWSGMGREMFSGFTHDERRALERGLERVLENILAIERREQAR